MCAVVILCVLMLTPKIVTECMEIEVKEKLLRSGSSSLYIGLISRKTEVMYTHTCIHAQCENVDLRNKTMFDLNVGASVCSKQIAIVLKNKPRSAWTELSG